MSDTALHDIRTLKPVQLDALREVANIGCGHAANALARLAPSSDAAPIEERKSRRVFMRSSAVAASWVTTVGGFGSVRWSETE